MRPTSFPAMLMIVTFFIAVLCGHQCNANTVQRPSSKPHIFVVIADDLGWADVGYHGSEIRTPVLDSLATAGVRLEQHYSSPLCTPSRAQFLTGRHQIHLGISTGLRPCEPLGLPLEVPTLAEELRNAGYSTNLIGKWHLGFFQIDYFPTRRGFDKFYGYLGGCQDYTYHRQCLTTTFKPACGYDLRDNEAVAEDPGHTYSSILFADKAKEVVLNHNSSQPLFLMLSMQAPHIPLQMAPGYEDQYLDIVDLDRRIYAGMVSSMDAQIGRVVQAFRDTGMWENTVMVFFSDNGGFTAFGANNDPLRGMKSQLWEGGIRTSAFVHSQLLDTVGVEMNGLMHITDWYPTLLELAGVAQSPDIYGHSVWEMISAGVPSPRNEVLLHVFPHIPTEPGQNEHLAPTQDEPNAAFRFGDWKLLTGHIEYVRMDDDGGFSAPVNWPLYLYNLADDPSETNDLSFIRRDLVLDLLRRLLDIADIRAMPLFSCLDERCRPIYHGDVWSPWIRSGDTVEPSVQYGCFDITSVINGVTDSNQTKTKLEFDL